ncbi:hypothetical protein Tco_0635300, partial [Tanacetum coccineum]
MMVVQLGYTGESEPLYYYYLRPLTTLDEGLYALACEEDVRFLATIVRSFKLIEVYIEHGVTVVNSYQRPQSHVKATIEDITKTSSSATVEHRSEKMLLLTWHDSSAPTKESVCDFVNLGLCLNMILVHLVIDDVIRQLSFKETELDEEAVVMLQVIVKDYVSYEEDAEHGNGQEAVEAPNPEVDVHLFGISMDVSFDNIGVTNLVPYDVLEGEDVDVIDL